MEFSKKEIDILDFMLAIINQSEKVLWLDTHEDFKVLFFKEFGETAQLEFTRYLKILQTYNLARIYSSDYNHDGIVWNENTRSFLERGGFKRLFQEEVEKQKKQVEKEILENELAKSNIEANKLNQRNSKFNKRTSIIVIIVGFINLLVFIYQVFIK